MAFYAVIPAGGSGTRLWPLSRRATPKFLHALVDPSQSLLQSTVERLCLLTSPENIFIATGARHVAAVSAQVPEISPEQMVAEPFPADSAPAIGLAAALIARRDPDAIMGSFAADHLVSHNDAFVDAVTRAIEVARQGYLVTVGIKPRHPETGYGYIRRAQALDPAELGAYAVAEFREKPSYDVARAYVESGEYLWNASMFVWRAAVLLNEIARQAPELHAGLRKIAAAWDTSSREEVLNAIWPTLPKISIDYAVMEGAAAAGKVATVPAEFGWNDVGDWDTLGEIVANATNESSEQSAEHTLIGDAVATARIISLDSSGCVLTPTEGRTIALLGVKDLIVVDTPDALLIADRSRAQDVKKLTEQLSQNDSLL